jgi:hypothetical protein
VCVWGVLDACLIHVEGTPCPAGLWIRCKFVCVKVFHGFVCDNVLWHHEYDMSLLVCPQSKVLVNSDSDTAVHNCLQSPADSFI